MYIEIPIQLLNGASHVHGGLITTTVGDLVFGCYHEWPLVYT